MDTDRRKLGVPHFLLLHHFFSCYLGSDNYILIIVYQSIYTNMYTCIHNICSLLIQHVCYILNLYIAIFSVMLQMVSHFTMPWVQLVFLRCFNRNRSTNMNSCKKKAIWTDWDQQVTAVTTFRYICRINSFFNAALS